MERTLERTKSRSAHARTCIVAAALLAVGACSDDDDALPTRQQGAFISASPDVIAAWNEHTLAALTAHDGYADPMRATRTLSLVHVAMHDAVSATGGRFQPYGAQVPDAAASPIAAAAAAAHRVLVQLFPAQASFLLDKRASSLAEVPDGDGEQRGIALGERVADVILAMRAHDQSDASLPYSVRSEPGSYQFTTPDVIAAPGWRLVTPWGLRTAEQFRPAPPPALSSATYASAFEEVKTKGRLDSTTRTPDETAYARFWYEFSDIGWNRVTRVVAAQQQLDLASSARLFALVNMALADSYIAGWDAKFFYDTWRPLTAIQRADADGNPATTVDPTFEPLLPTPPVQDYPSTHSALGAAAAAVLTRALGPSGERVGFRMTSSSASTPNVEQRQFASLALAARENADSRVMAGIHFRFACDAGLSLGEKIGTYVFDHYLQPRD